MTIRQVMNDVLALLSLTEEKVGALFYASLNRALDEIGHAFPKKAVQRLYHALPAPLYASYEEKIIMPSAPLRISGDGVYGFSLSAYGEGNITFLLDGEVIAEYAVSGASPLSLALKLSELSDKASGEVTLSFRSLKKLYLVSVALYDCDIERVIPYGEYYAYPVSAFDRRFLAFDGVATKRGQAINERTLRFGEDTVYIRSDADGVYDIPYLALPDTASSDNADDEIFLRADAMALVSLLTAYYLAVEDENSAASLFLARYEAIRNCLLSGRGEESVRDVYGW